VTYKDAITWGLIALALVGIVYIGSGCQAGQVREDKTTNKAVEKLCSSWTALQIFKVDKQIFREYLCMCQQVAGSVGAQNLCATTINLNESLAIIKACGTTPNTDCRDVFSRRK